MINKEPVSSKRRFDELVSRIKKDHAEMGRERGGGFTAKTGSGQEMNADPSLLNALYRKASKALKAFDEERSFDSLIQYFDAVGRFQFVAGPLSPVSLRIMDHMFPVINNSPKVMGIQDIMDKIDINDIRISRKDAEHLRDVSQYPIEEGHELSGGATITIPKGGPPVIKLKYTLEEHHKNKGIGLLGLLFDTDSHVLWHTHPLPYPHGSFLTTGPSKADMELSRNLHIPLLVGSTDCEKPFIHLVYKGKKHLMDTEP